MLPNDLETLQQEKQALYGDFEGNAAVAMQIIEALKSSNGWKSATYCQRFALIMLASKLCRMCGGEAGMNHKDNWNDAIGYLYLALKGM